MQDILRRDDLSGEDIAEQQESNWVFRCGAKGEASFAAEGFIAKIGGEFVDHWRKIR